LADEVHVTRIRIVIAPDGSTATAQVAAGPPCDEGDLRKACRAAGVTAGIDEQALRALGQQLEDPSAVVVGAILARGKAAQDGRDAHLLNLPSSDLKPGAVAAEGRINYRERDFLHPITNGQRLATIVSATRGSPGFDVRGEALAAMPGRPLTERLGPGTQRDGNTVLANCDGVVLHTEQLLDVVPLFTHAGNVDYASGNLHSNGSLLVQGDVGGGFQVTASGDIAVQGTVYGELLAEGSVLIERGVLGQECVRAGADFTCHHATNSTISAARKLVVEDQVHQCQVKARSVQVVNGKGSVRGGEVLARDHIEVRSAGAPAGTATTLAVGQLIDERATLARLSVATMRESREAQRFLDQGRGSKGLRKLVKASNHESAEQLRLKRRQRELLRDATIRIAGTCFGGVVVKFGVMQLRIHEDLHDVTFHFDLDRETIHSSQPTAAS
jgi:uncharacterized protein